MEEVRTVQPAQEREEKNNVALVGMILSIIGLIFLITIFGAGLGLILLFLGFVLGIIGLFYKPRGKAYVAVGIPLCIIIVIGCSLSYLWNSVKVPAEEFKSWIEVQEENKRFDNINQDIFNEIASEEFDKIVSEFTGSDIKAIFDAATGNNKIEKAAYIIFSAIEQGLENSLEIYEQRAMDWDNSELLNVIEDSDEALNDTFTEETLNDGEILEETAEDTNEEINNDLEDLNESEVEENSEVSEIFE